MQQLKTCPVLQHNRVLKSSTKGDTNHEDIKKSIQNTKDQSPKNSKSLKRISQTKSHGYNGALLADDNT